MLTPKVSAEFMNYTIRRRLDLRMSCTITLADMTLHVGRICGLMCLHIGLNGRLSEPKNGFM